MTDIKVSNISVPRIARNKRIYTGDGNQTSVKGGGGGTIIEWAVVTSQLVTINRSLAVEGDLTVANLAGNEGDIVFVDANGTMGTMRQVLREVPSGVIDNVNKVYTLAHIPILGTELVYKNGQLIDPSLAYSIVDDVITLSEPLLTDTYYTDFLCVSYRYVTYGGAGSATAATVPYTAMTRGAACETTGFDVKASRIGRSITITGKFTTIINPSSGAIIATIPISTIAEGMDLSNRIYGMASTVDSLDANRGVRFYVEAFLSTDTNMQIIVDNARDNIAVNFTLTFNVI